MNAARDPGAGDTLARLIAAAYAQFDRPPPPTTGVCRGCCMDPAIEADFLNHAARDLPLAYIEDWYFAAHAADLGRAHMAWLLPRILDLLAFAPGFGRQGLEVTLNRLPPAGFPDHWPAADVALVADCCLAIFSRRLRAPGACLDEWLCCFGEGGLDIAPFLAHLDALPDARLAALLARDWPPDPDAAIPFSAFWARQPAKDRVWEWYTSRRLRDRLAGVALAGGPLADAALAMAAMIETHADWAQPPG
ncbi:hypothetical protein GE300_00645 [Rhodobacteraceae bacterium 2CG4]|uniref:Uncharacterized protein n=1 Tax=Halovulum marinum TaxID=2662447 RepID=A0A6L5YVN1_9RHOB|nr:hypothetical protein [Halovulum marinum]MSU88120.1 hypothetical protein [Halovulum marinum]